MIKSYEILNELVVSVFTLRSIFNRDFVVSNNFSAKAVKEDRTISQNINHALNKMPQ